VRSCFSSVKSGLRSGSECQQRDISRNNSGSLVTRALATQHSHYTRRDAHLRYRKPTEIVRVILLCVQLLKKSDPLHRDRPNREKELYTAPRRVACGASPRPPLTPSAYPSQRASWRNRRRQQLPSPHTAPLIAAHSSSASSHSPPCRRSTGPPWPCSPASEALRCPARAPRRSSPSTPPREPTSPSRS